jgi:RNA polymerase sigma-70 factor (ECF subfamily)
MSFDSVLTEQSDPLTRRILRIVGDRGTAEDLRQETLVRAWRAAPREAEPERLRAWLHRTAVNLALDELRRRRRRRLVPLEPDLPAPAVGDPLGLEEALAALAAHERLALLLRFEAGLSLRELGERLGVSEEAARKRVARARESLLVARRELERDARSTVLVLLGREEPGPTAAGSSARARACASRTRRDRGSTWPGRTPS